MRMSRKSGKTILVILVIIGCFLLFKYVLVSDEARIRRVISQGKAAIEKEDFEKALKLVSRDYQDDFGLNKLAVAALLKRLFHEFDAIEIHIEEMEVEVREQGLGQATLLTWVTARMQDQTGFICGSTEEPCRVTFFLAKEGGRWLVTKVTGVEPEEAEAWL